MSQSPSMSLIEVITGVTTGFLLSLALQALLFPVVGLQATVSQNLKLALGFTALSVLRGYTVRRLFEAVAARGTRGEVRSSGGSNRDRRGKPCARIATIPTGGRVQDQTEEAEGWPRADQRPSPRN